MDEVTSMTSVRLFLATVIMGALAYGALLAAKFFIDLRHRMKYLSQFPTMKSHWLLGHTYDLPEPNETGLAWAKKLLYKFPEGCALGWYGPVIPAVETFHSKTVKAILRTSEPKPRQWGAYNNLYPWLGDSILMSEFSKWSRNRRLLTPAFHSDVLRSYMTVNNRATDIFLSKLDKYASTGEYFEMMYDIGLLTLDIILRCAYSYDIDCQRQGDNNRYVQTVLNMGEAVVYRMVRPWLYPQVFFYLSSIGRQFKKDCDFVHGITENIIRKRKETLRTQGIEAVKKSRYLDFLDVLLTAKDDNGNGLSDREIRDEADTFLFEGHDNPASCISWTLYSLAQHPEHQEKCQLEIDKLLASTGNKDIEWDDLPKLNYLTMCIKEGLRLHSPVPFIQRQTTKDLEIAGRKVPAGTIVDIHLYGVHHNPSVWEDPEEFRPERFSSEKLAETDNYAFVPFSAGPKNCIGQNFAMHEMKTVIAKTLHRFTLSLDPARIAEHRIKVAMKTENGMYMKATRREPTVPATAAKPAEAVTVE